MQGFVVHPSLAVALSGFVALPLLFVLSLYFWRFFGYADANRNETGTIQRRFISALLACTCSAFAIYALAVPATAGRGLTYPELLGLQLQDLARACAVCVAITAALFIGPIVQHLVCVSQGEDLCSLTSEPRWILARNLLMAPVTEEFVFRACLIRLWVGAGFSDWVIVFCSPMCFATAHAHHFLELSRGSRVADSGYGKMEESGKFMSDQGFPDVGFLVSEAHPVHPWRVLIAGVYLLGIFAFSSLLVPLTAGFQSTFSAAAGSAIQ